MEEALAKVIDHVRHISADLDETRKTVFALASALTNQPRIDRVLLSQDFVTELRSCKVNLNEPSNPLAALLMTLQTPREKIPGQSIGEQRLWPIPAPDERDPDQEP